MILSIGFSHMVNKVGFRRSVEMIAAAGFDAFDCSFSNKAVMLPLVEADGYMEHAREIRKIAEDNGILCVQAHAPFNGWEPSPEHLVLRSIEMAAEIGAGAIVTHPLHYKNYPAEIAEKHEENVRYYRRLMDQWGGSGITVCVENMYRWNEEKTRYAVSECGNPEEFAALIDEVERPDFGACLDTGHAHICAKETGCSVADCIRVLGKRIRALHVHDNYQWQDIHQIPFCGSIAWEEVFSALKETGYEGPFNYETSNLFMTTPAELFPEALKSAEQVGRYLTGQLLSREERETYGQPDSQL